MQTRNRGHGFILWAWCFSFNCFAETYVTTYVTRVQEERRDTRWTLTEWLRIKERMKLMDVWLKMFSNPEKDTFRPELSLSYGMRKGALTRTDEENSESRADFQGSHGKAQLWLTNLISSTIGVRMLNIDFGVEGGMDRLSAPMTKVPRETSVAGAGPVTDLASDLTDGPGQISQARHYYTGNLRIFGGNIQDSMLVLKYGHFQWDETLESSDKGTLSTTVMGQMAGAELQVYLLKWLGLEGNYSFLKKDSGSFRARDQVGAYVDYQGFVEVSLLRLMFGAYEWQGNPFRTNLNSSPQYKERGVMGGIKIQL